MADREGVGISTTGAYTISISGFFGSGAGPYQFQIHEVPATTSSAINHGDIVKGTLSIPGEEVEFTFDGNTGQILFFDAIVGIGGLEWTLTSPSASEIFNGTLQDQSGVELTEPGTYTLNLDGELDAIGDFEFRTNDVTPTSPASINFGEEVFASIDFSTAL